MVCIFHRGESLYLFVSVFARAELLTDRELVEKDLRAVQLNALEEECKRVARIELSHYNQDQVLGYLTTKLMKTIICVYFY